jgi:hypothetical protein
VTRSQLKLVHAANALPHTPRYGELAPYHVPFDELTGTRAVEGELARWIGLRGRIALIGASGSGKSSALAWVLARTAPPRLLPLRVPVALADDETVQTSGGFARHLVRRVLAAARLEGPGADDLRARSANTVRRRARGQQRSRRVGFNLGVVTGELAQELVRAGDELEEQVMAGEVVEGLQRLIRLFRARGVEPLLVLEDTDTWLARPHDRQPAELAELFFNRNVRMLANEIDCGFVVAVHTSYLELAAYREIAPRLERVRVPGLVDPEGGLARIIGRRLEVARTDIEVEQLFEPAALAALASVYADLPDIRRTLATAAAAVRLGLEDGDLERVTAAAVRAAAAEQSDGLGGNR